MKTLQELYGHSLALLTDLYQLTMAYGYWKNGTAEREAVFHQTFRASPFGGQYAIACGLDYVVGFLRAFRFTDDDLGYLATLEGADSRALFDEGFLRYLGDLEFACDVDAIPEGTVVFPHEPLVRVRGPLLQCQLLETPLLNLVNFQTLIATKSSRIATAARGDPVLEFGLRRAQGIDGGLTASRAAFVGGCAATSNVLAGKLFDIPVKGTHAHSWIMSFDDELEAFRSYAEALPNNCVFLVDTYDTVAGVHKAAEIGRMLQGHGHRMIGIRLDSGDLAELSKESRRILDQAGHADAIIVASNDLDEFLIEELKQQGAKINVWGVGTKLATAYDQPALGGVYKLSALHKDGGWVHKIKLSEQSIKVSNPGILQVRRFKQSGRFVADMIHDEITGVSNESSIIVEAENRSLKPDAASFEDLLVPVFRQGESVYEPPAVHAAQERTKNQLDQFDPSIRILKGATPYLVGLEERLHMLKRELMSHARRGVPCN